VDSYNLFTRVKKEYRRSEKNNIVIYRGVELDWGDIFFPTGGRRSPARAQGVVVITRHPPLFI